MSPLQRKAAIKAAATLREISLATVARQMGVSYNHLMLVLAGERKGSTALERRIATFLDRPVTAVFPESTPGSRRSIH
jgi:transcriptional regulator with XRE-family HTH domain